MKTIKHFLLTLVALLCSISASAHDFEVDGIYYQITSSTDLTVAVSCKGYYGSSYSKEYSGSVTIPESVTYNGNIYSVTSIGDDAFSGCSGLTSVTIPNSVTSIDAWAFQNCTGLASVTIPNSVTSIGSHAFEGCSGLTSVTIPNSVTSIGGYAFKGCSGLTSIKVDEANQTYDSRNNCNAIIETETNELIVGCKSTVIPNSVTSIGYSAFEDCSGLTSVTIPNSVTSIGDSAFEGCSGLTSVTIPNSVTSIGYYAFDGSGLTSVTIPNSVTSIGYDAFRNCDGLKEVHISDIAAWCKIDFGNYESNPLSYAKHLFLDGEEIKDLVIPNSVTSIGEYTFGGCGGLTSVIIPNSVTSIRYSAFWNCSGLTSIKVDEANQTYDSRNNCNAIIETETNELIVGFKSTVIPNSVTSIGWYAFYGCSGLTSVTIPNSMTSIGWSAFSGCTGLTSVTIGNSVTGIGGYAFYGCSGLTSVTIPNSVTSIGSYAFSGCSGLTSVVIPNSITSIGDYAFRSCSELTDVYCYAEQVPFTISSAFADSYVEYATLHVPDASIEEYKAKTPWSGFGAIVALPAEKVELTIGTTGATTFCSEYALDFTDAEGVKAYAATGYNTETGVVTLTRVKTAKAGTGLFVVGDEGTYSIPTIESSADNSLNMLVGTTEEVTIPTADGTYTNYIYGKSDDNTGFFKLTGDKVIPAGKAYLRIPTEWFPAVAESKIKIEFEDGTTTGIDDVEEQVRPNDGVIYDLHGRVVKNPGKGIYIVNGKKVLF